MLNAFLYDASGSDHPTDLMEDRLPKLADDKLLWVEVRGRDADEIGRVAKLLGINRRAEEALARPAGGAAINNYADHFHCRVAAIEGSEAKNGDGLHPPGSVGLDIVVGENWLVTVADDALGFLEEFRARDRGETMIGRLSAGTLAASLLDWHLTEYLAAIQRLEAWLDVLDLRLLASKSSDRSLLRKVVDGRRFVSRLRRNLAPQRAVFYGLSRPDFSLIAGSEAKEAFAGLERRFDRVIDSVEHGRELVQGSFDLFSTRIAESTNTLVRRLTFVSIVLGGISAIAGIFGMNFQTSLTNTGAAGFWIVVGTMAAGAVAALAVSRSRDWI